MITGICLGVVAILMIATALTGIVRANRRISALGRVDQVSPAGGATEPPSFEPARALWPEADELEAARWRSKRFKKEQKAPRPMQERFRKALERFVAEWGFDLQSAEHHVYDYSDHDQHVVFIRMETRTAREKRFS